MFGILTGSLLGGIALIIALDYAGGGHGTYVPAKILFPYTMYLALAVVGRITFPLLLLAIIEFPVYGVAVAFAAKRGRLLVTLVSVLVLHMAMTGVCLRAKNVDFARDSVSGHPCLAHQARMGTQVRLVTYPTNSFNQ